MELKVKVIPKSSRSEIVGNMADGTLKVKIAAAPERGKANAELREVLARAYNCRPSDVEILSGETSQLKRVRVVPGPARPRPA